MEPLPGLDPARADGLAATDEHRADDHLRADEHRAGKCVVTVVSVGGTGPALLSSVAGNMDDDVHTAKPTAQ